MRFVPTTETDPRFVLTDSDHDSAPDRPRSGCDPSGSTTSALASTAVIESACADLWRSSGGSRTSSTTRSPASTTSSPPASGSSSMLTRADRAQLELTTCCATRLNECWSGHLDSAAHRCARRRRSRLARSADRSLDDIGVGPILHLLTDERWTLADSCDSITKRTSTSQDDRGLAQARRRARSAWRR